MTWVVVHRCDSWIDGSVWGPFENEQSARKYAESIVSDALIAPLVRELESPDVTRCKGWCDGRGCRARCCLVAGHGGLHMCPNLVEINDVVVAYKSETP